MPEPFNNSTPNPDRPYILAIDQGTTSSRALLFDEWMNAIGIAQQEIPQYYPQSGWVEHDPEDLWSITIASCRSVIDKTGVKPESIKAIGITNQRETTIIWDRKTGQPIHKAIVWQDRRTTEICEKLRRNGHSKTVSDRTGLLIDPYFSATKISWILDNIEGARVRAEQGELLFGTVDTFLVWKMTNGRVHATDATNAARTMLYDIRKGCWSKTISDLLNIPMNILPEVKNCADDFGLTHTGLFGCKIPIRGVAGDQQSATIGQACFEPGMLKATYGTGCFALLNTGETPVISKNQLLTTIAYQLNDKPIYALEGSIFIAGAVVQWLRDGLKIIRKAEDTQPLADLADESQNVIMVPAFTGLGAPYWAPECRGGIFGLTRNSGPCEFAKAALESIGYQTRDLLEAMYSDWNDARAKHVLRVDGGMSVNSWAMQFLADIIAAPVDCPPTEEVTALGVAWLAGQEIGLYPDQDSIANTWQRGWRYSPKMEAQKREVKYAKWQSAVNAVISVSTETNPHKDATEQGSDKTHGTSIKT